MAHNKAEILRVADAIEQHSIADLGFNMATFGSAIDEGFGEDGMFIDHSGHKCGTVACIAGWASALNPREHGSPSLVGQKVFNLTLDESRKLFMPKSAGDLDYISTAQAVAVLRHLADTGVVDWSIA